jgi:hypothetical protein
MDQMKTVLGAGALVAADAALGAWCWLQFFPEDDEFGG